MPLKPSLRAQAVEPFLAMEFGKRAAELEARGHRVIRLNLGEPDFGAPPSVVRAMHRALDEQRTAYTAALGIPALREAIARHYAVHGAQVDARRVVVTAGASAALLLLTMALVNEGDEVLVGDPSYPCNRQFLAGSGARVRLVPTDAASRFQLDADSVARNWSPATRGLLVATPSNPTGTSIALTELAAICAHAARHDAWRIVDEIYLGLQDGDATHPRARSVLAVDPEAIVVNSFSKYFGMTGWRLGWCVVPPELVGPVERLAQNFYICASAPAQHAAVSCFDAESIAVCDQRREQFARRRGLVLRGLSAIGLDVPVPPDGAFYVYIDVRSTGMDAMRFCERALEEAHVALTPGRDFGSRGADAYVRLSYSASEGDLAEAIERLGTLVARRRNAAA